MANKVQVSIEVVDKTKVGITSAKKEFKGLGDAIQSISFGQVLALGGVTIGLKKVLTAMADFDTKVREIGTLIPGVTDRLISTISDELLDSSVRYGQAIDQMAKARYDAVSAGFVKVADSARLIEVSAKLAVGGVSNIAKTMDVLTSVLNAYEYGAKGAYKVSDIIFETVRLGKTTVDQLAGSLGTVAAVAPTLDVSLEEVAAGFSALTIQGLSTDEVATALQASMVSLLKPSTALEEKLKSLGYETGAAAVRALGFKDTIKVVTEGANEADLAALFPNIRAMRAIFPLVGAAAERFNEHLGQMHKAAGATDRAFGLMEEGIGFRFAQMKARISKLSIEIGQALLPIGEGVVNIIETFTELPVGFQTSTVAMVGFGVAVGALAPLIKNLITVGKALVPVLLQARIAVTGFFASLGPGGWLLIGLGALTTLLLSLVSTSRQAASGITFLTGSMDESAKATKRLESAIGEASQEVRDFNQEIENLSLAELEAKLLELEKRRIEVSLGVIPEISGDIPSLPEIPDPLKFQVDFTTTGIDETNQAITAVESESVKLYTALSEQIEALQAKIRALKSESADAARALSSEEKKALEEVEAYRQEKTADMILRMARDEIEEREKADQELLDAYNNRLANEYEMFVQGQEAMASLRAEFLLTDEQRELQHLVDRLNAWNQNWADLEEGQRIFQAGLEAIQRRSLANQQNAWMTFVNSISSHMISSIGNYAIGYLDRRFGDFIARQRNEFGRFLAFIVSEFIKAVAKMVAEAQAAKLMKTLLGGGGPLGFLSFLFHSGGIVGETPGMNRGGIAESAPGMARGRIVSHQTGKFVAFIPRGVDTVPAMLEPGEAVIPREVVRENRPLIERLISGEELFRGYSDFQLRERIERVYAPGLQAGGIMRDRTLSPHPTSSLKAAEVSPSKEVIPPQVNVYLNMAISAIDGASVEKLVSGPDFRRALADTINTDMLRLRAGNTAVDVKY